MAITISDRSRNYLRKRVEDHMLARIEIFPAEEGTFDETTGVFSVPSRVPFYDGKARIRLLSSGNEIVIGESEISMADTTISIPHDSPRPNADDVIVVTSNPPSTVIEGYVFVIINFEVGGLAGASMTINCRSLDANASWHRV